MFQSYVVHPTLLTKELVSVSVFLAKREASRLEDRMGWVGMAAPEKAMLDVQKVMVKDLDRSEKKDCLVRRGFGRRV